MAKLNKRFVLVSGVILLCAIYEIFLHSIQTHFSEWASQETNWIETDIAQYSEIRDQWYNEALFGHFPSNIPPSANEVHLFYSPPFLQKGLLFQLWLKLPADELRLIHSKFNEMASQTDRPKLYISRFHPALTMYHISDNPEGRMLPTEYEIIVLDQASKDEGNHGHIYGVAINTTTSEILYWAEAW